MRVCAELQYILDPRMELHLIQVDHMKTLKRNGFPTQDESHALSTELIELGSYGSSLGSIPGKT